jgi:hypothetical protein
MDVDINTLPIGIEGIEQDSLYHPDLLQSLNQNLRQQLAARNAPLVTLEQRQEKARQVLMTTVASRKLGRAVFSQALNECYDVLTAIYTSLNLPPEQRSLQYINRRGLVMSPDYCIKTITDTARVDAFWQALEPLIIIDSNTEGKLQHLVYPACGPYAPLLLPLLHSLKQQERLNPKLKVTLIDVHPAAAQTALELVNLCDLADQVNVLCLDACDYQAEPGSVNILLLESMQHGFGREAHLSICQHFEPMLANDAIMVPENISIRAVLAKSSEEFPLAGRDTSIVNSNRMELGSILEVNRQSLQQLHTVELDEGNSLVECDQVKIPDDIMDAKDYILMLTTRIKVAENCWIEEYESGISHPLPDLSVCIGFTPNNFKTGDLLAKPGDSLKFYYRKLGLPGFLPTLVESEVSS